MAYLRKNNPPRPMTRGRAIIEARIRLGNGGAVHCEPNLFCIGLDNGGGFIPLVKSTVGWEDCLAQLDHSTP